MKHLPTISRLSIVLFVAASGTAAIAGAAEKKTNPIVVEAKLVAKSRMPTLKEIAPYVEALVLNHYKVLSVKQGALDEEQIVVAQWGIFEKKPTAVAALKPGSKHTLRLRPLDEFKDLKKVKRSETLDIEVLLLPSFLDVGQNQSMEEGAGWAKDRYGAKTGKMLEIHKLRHQLKLVTIGDSRPEAGLNPELFYPEENKTRPVAYNICVGSTGLRYATMLMRDYFTRLPKLEWVVHGFSLRIAEKGYAGREGTFRLLENPGLTADRANKFADWAPDPKAKPITFADFAWSYVGWHGKIEPFGWDRHIKGPLKAGANPSRFSAVAYRYDFDMDMLGEYERCIQLLGERGVKVLAFTPPQFTHPESDGDGEDAVHRTDYARILGLLRGMRATHPNLFVHDIHKFGDNGFVAEEYANKDHLNPQKGAPKLTAMVEKLRHEHQDAPARRTGTAPAGLLGARSGDGAAKAVTARLKAAGRLNGNAVVLSGADALDAARFDDLAKGGSDRIILLLSACDFLRPGTADAKASGNKPVPVAWDVDRWTALHGLCFTLEGTASDIGVVVLPAAPGLPAWAGQAMVERLKQLDAVFPNVALHAGPDLGAGALNASGRLTDAGAGKLAAWLGRRLQPPWTGKLTLEQTSAPGGPRWRALREMLPAVAGTPHREGCFNHVPPEMQGLPVLFCAGAKQMDMVSFTIDRPAKILVVQGLRKNTKKGRKPRRRRKPRKGRAPAEITPWSAPGFEKVDLSGKLDLLNWEYAASAKTFPAGKVAIPLDVAASVIVDYRGSKR